VNVPAALSDDLALFCLFCLFLIPLAAAGLALINTGLGRARSAGHAMLASLLAMAVAALAYFVCGFAWQGYAGGPAHVLTIAGRSWNWIAAERFFFRSLPPDNSSAILVAGLQLLAVSLAALIPLGSGLDRWRLGAVTISTALLAGWTYPLFAHWVWDGGWLAQLGANYHLGSGFLDSGGASTIHATGGLTALAIAWILGARRGKFPPEGMPAVFPGHNAVLVIFGCSLALAGWLGLNSAGAILFGGAGPQRLPLVAINTVLAACSAGVTAAATTRLRFGKPDASLTANSWVGGLVAGSAGCCYFAPLAAVVVGIVAGLLVTFSVEFIELRLTIDDPGGAVSAHAVCGLWGILAVGLFSRSGTGQWMAQLLGVATLLGVVLPMTYGLNWLVNRFYPQRVAGEAEREGMDLFELGAEAYPEFVTEDFSRR
jgi:Amt family ammonium transporter